MAETDDVIYNEQFLDGTNNEYILKTVNIDDVISAMCIDELDSAITKSIILGIEEEASKGIKENMRVSLPYIGNVQRDIYKDLLSAHNKELRLARAEMTKDEYKEYAKEVRRNLKNEAKQNYIKRKTFEKYKRGRVKSFDKLAKSRGIAWANLYVQSIIWLKSIDYNQDVQDQYDRISGRYIE